jgi:hypothetical protein
MNPEYWTASFQSSRACARGGTPTLAAIALPEVGPYGLGEAAPSVDYRRARTSTHPSSTNTSSTHSPAPPTASANSSGVQTKNQRLPRGMSSAHPVTPLIFTDALMGAPDLATRASSPSASAARSDGRWIREALAHTASKEADIRGSDRRSPSTTGPWALAWSMKLRFRSTPTPRWSSSPGEPDLALGRSRHQARSPKSGVQWQTRRKDRRPPSR